MRRDPHALDDRALGALLRARRRACGIPAKGPDDPDDDVLLRCLEGTAGSAERRAFEERLDRSPRARALVAILGAALDATDAAPEAEPSVLHAVLLVARDALRLLRASQAPLCVAGAGVVRGAAVPPAPTYYEFVAHVSDLEARVALDRATDRVDVRLALTRAGAPVRDVRVALTRDDELLASKPTEADGTCTFGIPDVGHYRLEVRRAGRAIGVVRLDFMGEGAAA